VILFRLGARNATALAVAFFLCADAVAADAEAGKAKAQVCVACHGPGGNSTNPAVPALAGQPAQMIATQLYQFREGNRKDPQMSPMAANLSNTDMNDLAAYFSGIQRDPAQHKASPENAAAGPQLTKKFYCTQCHGPALLGQQHIPRLAGQQAEYLRAQLKKFKASQRADMDGNMTSAAQALGEKDIDVIVDYLAGLGPQ
jgi:cytochrome c553